MTPYQKHVAEWQDCQRCSLCHGRKQVVFARGSIPCDVLFVGEAPGVSEDVLGMPFKGPAGHLLDQIIEQAQCRVEDARTMAFYNLVSCFPKEEKDAGTNEPPDEAIKACLPKLKEFIAIARPRLVVAVGSLADTWINAGTKLLGLSETKIVTIVHPAAILRANFANRGLMIQRCIVTLADALEEM